MLIDGQVSGAPQNLIWGNEKKLIDKVVSAKDGIDTDKKIAQTLNGLLRDGRRRFVYVVLRGSHYQYASNLPAEEVSPEMSNIDIYERSIAYSKREFFDAMLRDVNREQAAIFYTSDHGQYLESGVIPHCNTIPHDEEFYVPLVLFPPLQLMADFSENKPASSINSHSQIFPTTLYLMGFSKTYAEDQYDNLLPGASKRLIRFGKRIFPVSRDGGIDVKEVSVEQ
jgi:glucan phosphoethanolaminetransferase (alkaline phosphatase superfamily)